ncbi:sensor histidine kinase [Erythrobacter sp. HL-111]|uniref:sensor histidine kinase n=1 Tax=Erythrobacter sp. HL-111 TaxID=1798193 RepID=UPI0006D97431|nr:MAG: Signal transduction histidine kinase [Erythrobacteraceae bacterium HL-111]SDS87200.1 Signal transduction histidine kinase [Erythrobacter sp. HL-111]
MKRLLAQGLPPRSLLGQVMAVFALGLLIAQAISAVLLYRASEERREAAIVSSLAYRLIAEAGRSPEELARRAERRTERRAERSAGRRAAREARRAEPDAGERRRLPGRPPFAGPARIPAERTNAPPPLAGDARSSAYEDALARVLAAQDIAAGRILVAERRAGEDPFLRALVERRPRRTAPGWEERSIVIAAIERPGSGEWLTVRLPVQERPRGGLATILLQTAVIFVVVVLLLYFVLRRITRPLAALTARLADFSRAPGKALVLAESGPADTRRLIAAYNRMAARIAALLDEKDVMLGAIGHDLKTPLAALRVRIESVADERQRERMAAGIADITATLDDILALARVGHAGGSAEAVDLAALAGAVAEEFEDLGAPVEWVAQDGPRIVARVRETWAKRALRNLVANAVRYGGGARVVLLREDGEAVLAVEDEGPGIPADRIEAMMQPFARGEASRNRATGGAGLGLTLARAIAEAEGGSLRLANRAGGGLRAELRFPFG